MDSFNLSISSPTLYSLSTKAGVTYIDIKEQ